MKKIIFILLAGFSLAACTNHGKKIKVEGTKGEVYYKGDGVTEEDAKKTGEFLKEEFFSSGKEASVQITKENDAYVLRFVYKKDVYDTLKGLDNAFKIIAAKASKELFGGKKVNIALADKNFKDFATIPYDEAVAKKLNAPTDGEEELFVKEDFDHDAMGGVNFYWKDISDAESKRIADYIVENGSFAGGTAELYMTKSGDRTIITFPMIESAINNPAYRTELEKVSSEIKENVFGKVPFSFQLMDEKLNIVQVWEY